jgi:hypothetical protein
LGEHAGVERSVVGGDKFDLDEVLTGGEGGESFVQAVIHGDELAVDQQVDVALVGSDVGGGLGDDLSPVQAQSDLGGLAADGLAVGGSGW